MENKLEEIMTEAMKEETTQLPPQETEEQKKERIKYEKKCASLEKARATRARNKAAKEQKKEIKMKMLEKIHERVESLDLSALMNKIDEIATRRPQKYYPTAEYEAPKPKKKVETAEIVEEESEEEVEEEVPFLMRKVIEQPVYETDEYSFLTK